MCDEKFGLRSRATCRLADMYEMVDDPSTDSTISWSENGKSFIVWKPEEFCRDLLPKLFRHSDFSVFIRTLKSFGFRKVECERLEFADDDFVRGEPKRIRNIYNRSDELMARRTFMLRRKSMKRKRKMTKKIDKEAADLLGSLHI